MREENRRRVVKRHWEERGKQGLTGGLRHSGRMPGGRERSKARKWRAEGSGTGGGIRVGWGGQGK